MAGSVVWAWLAVVEGQKHHPNSVRCVVMSGASTYPSRGGAAPPWFSTGAACPGCCCAPEAPTAASGNCCLKFASRSSPGFCELVLMRHAWSADRTNCGVWESLRVRVSRIGRLYPPKNALAQEVFKSNRARDTRREVLVRAVRLGRGGG